MRLTWFHSSVYRWKYSNLILRSLVVPSCHLMSCHVASCHLMSPHVMSCHLMSCRVASCPSCHPMSLMSPHVPHVTVASRNKWAEDGWQSRRSHLSLVEIQIFFMLLIQSFCCCIFDFMCEILLGEYFFAYDGLLLIC